MILFICMILFIFINLIFNWVYGFMYERINILKYDIHTLFIDKNIIDIFM